MSMDDLLDELSRRRIGLHLDGDKLRFRAPQGALTAELRTAIAQHRPAIISRLRGANTTNRTASCTRHGVRDFGNWVDDSPIYGRIRTTCRLCGSFIGFRPHRN